MNFLTKKQKDFIDYQELKIGKFYALPSSCTYYKTENDRFGDFVSLGPTQVCNDFLEIKEFCQNDRLKINFVKVPENNDFFINKLYLQVRNIGESIMIRIFCFIPFVCYNLFNKIRGKKCV